MSDIHESAVETTYKEQSGGVGLQDRSRFEGLLFSLFGFTAVDRWFIDVTKQTFVAVLVGGVGS